MKTKAVRLYGKEDLRLEEFELPILKHDEILMKIVSDSLCMSSYKEAIQGGDHKRVPNNIAEEPIIIGHEFCGEIVEVGEKWQSRFKAGQKVAIQPALNLPGSPEAIGYSYTLVGGDATYVILHNAVMEQGCLFPFEGDAFFGGSLSEPLACVCCASHSMFHIPSAEVYAHEMGIKEGGKMVMMAAVGPMGLACIDYTLHGARRPGLLVITDIDQGRLDRAAKLLSVEDAAKNGVELHYINTRDIDAHAVLMELTGGTGYDDAIVFAPVPAVVELADGVLGHDGCLNFFSGPGDPTFSSRINLYNVHYNATHIMGSAGSNTDDMKECLQMISEGKLNPAFLVTHIGGLNCVAEATLNLPKIPGGKKLIYTHVDMPLTAIADFAELGKTDPFYAKLAELTAKTDGLWNAEAEKFLLAEKAGK